MDGLKRMADVSGSTTESWVGHLVLLTSIVINFLIGSFVQKATSSILTSYGQHSEKKILHQYRTLHLGDQYRKLCGFLFLFRFYRTVRMWLTIKQPGYIPRYNKNVTSKHRLTSSAARAYWSGRTYLIAKEILFFLVFEKNRNCPLYKKDTSCVSILSKTWHCRAYVPPVPFDYLRLSIL